MNCSICSQIHDSKSRSALRTVLESLGSPSGLGFNLDRAVIFPSIGALTEGHMIICPEHHVESLSRLREHDRLDFMQVTAHLN